VRDTEERGNPKQWQRMEYKR